MEIIKEIELEQIMPHQNNRKVGGFQDAKLEELAESIKAHGVLEPIIVRQLGDGSKYELVAGERRWRASKIAGVGTIPALVRELSDEDAIKIRTIENLQREDLHPLDELENYRELIDVCGYTVDQISTEIGRSPAYVKRRLSLHRLADPVREKLAANEITLSNALLIARLPADLQEDAFEMAADFQGEPKSSKQFRDDLERSYTVDLVHAPWGRGWTGPDDDPAPACVGCEFRTKENEYLFPELNEKDDRCMKPVCYYKKLRLWVAKVRNELHMKAEDFIEVNNTYGSTQAEGALDMWEYTKVGKDVEGAKKALIVSGEGAGTIIYVLTGEDRYQRQIDPDERAAYEEKIDEHEKILRINAIAVDVIREELTKEISKEIPRKVCEIIMLNAFINDRKEIEAAPDMSHEEEGKWGMDPRKAVAWLASLTVEALRDLTVTELLELVAPEYADEDDLEAAAALAGCFYDTIMEESRAQAEKQAEGEGE